MEEKENRKGHPFGLHRVLDPKGSLPQPAWKLDARPICYDNELLLDVHCLNIDSASFRQLKMECNYQVAPLVSKICSIISERGKMHNPITQSGGMCIGEVREVGPFFPHQVAIGARVATLVSLTLTPLYLEKVESINLQTGQIEVTGKAVLFASGPFAILPEDFPESLALAVLDVCGAPLQTARMVQAGQTVVVLGAGGKSGLLSLAQAKWKAGETGKVIALEASQSHCDEIRALGLADEVLQIDAEDSVAVWEAVRAVTQGRLADVTINCVNAPHTECSSILATKDQGTVYFFSTAVQFTAASLGAEGLGKDVKMMIGNGYAPGHADMAFDTLRRNEALRNLFEHRYESTVIL